MGDDQIASDEMGGGRCSDANFDVMGDVGQSNVDNDLHKQPDQIVDQSNILDEFLDVQPNPNQGEAIDFCESNVLGLRVSSPVLDDLNKHQNQNTGDLRGGGTITGENLDAMGVVSQSNFDDDLHRQPDQNVDHSNVLNEFLVMAPNPNDGEAIEGGTSGGVENVGDDFGDSNVLDRSVSRMTNDSFGSITLQEYSKTEISQEYSKDELDSDLDITCSDSGSTAPRGNSGQFLKILCQVKLK